VREVEGYGPEGLEDIDAKVFIFVLQKALQVVFVSVISVRVPRELKEEMRKLNINWSEEIRKFIARRIDEELRKRRIEEALAMLRGTGSVERGFAEKAVREDRDSR